MQLFRSGTRLLVCIFGSKERRYGLWFYEENGDLYDSVDLNFIMSDQNILCMAENQTENRFAFFDSNRVYIL